MFITDFPTTVDVEDNLLKTTNRAYSVLKFPIGPTDSSIEVIDASKFPLGAQLITIENEILACSSRIGNIFTVDFRGYSGTLATLHEASVIVALNFTSHHWNNLIDAVIAIETFIMNGAPTPSQTIINSGMTSTIRTIPKLGFSDIDFKIKIIENISFEIIKMNLRIIKSPTQLQNVIYGKTGTMTDSDLIITIYETVSDIVIDLQNLRPNSVSVLITNEI